MRLQVGSSEWILRIGDGIEEEANNGEATIEIPNELLIRDAEHDLISSIVDAVFISVSQYSSDSKYFQERAILAPTNECVEKISDHLLSFFQEKKGFI
ncbi:50S ribosomal protein L3 [Bienertia sinuspersici]